MKVELLWSSQLVSASTIWIDNKLKTKQIKQTCKHVIRCMHNIDNKVK